MVISAGDGWRCQLSRHRHKTIVCGKFPGLEVFVKTPEFFVRSGHASATKFRSLLMPCTVFCGADVTAGWCSWATPIYRQCLFKGFNGVCLTRFGVSVVEWVTSASGMNIAGRCLNGFLRATVSYGMRPLLYWGFSCLDRGKRLGGGERCMGFAVAAVRCLNRFAATDARYRGCGLPRGQWGYPLLPK